MARGKHQPPPRKVPDGQHRPLAQLDSLEIRVFLSAGHHHVHAPHARRAVPRAHSGVIVVGHSAPVGKTAGKGAKPANGTGPIGKTPTQILHAYGFDNVNFNGSIAANGAGQTIAIIDAYYSPTAYTDLQQFDAAFGLPDPVFTAVDQRGNPITATNHPITEPTANTWTLETALDVEWAHAIAPQAKILLVETDTDNFDDLLSRGAVYASGQPGVSVVSMSFGGPEFAGELSYDSDLTTPAGHPNVTFVASTGDTASPAQYPSVSPNVVAVGGTSLTLTGAGDYSSETGWSQGGGGLSNTEPRPGYQAGITVVGRRRGAPDVSFVGDPNTGVAVYDSTDSATLPWLQVGGTSLSAPIFGALVAIADQGRSTVSLNPLDGHNDTLPMLYTAPASDFRDITTGNNGFAAGPGYDLVTGIGTPRADLLIPYLSQVPSQAGVSVTTGTNNILVTRDPDNLHADVTINGGPVQQLLLSQSTPFIFNGGTGDDTFTFDFSQGDPLPAAGASISGGSGGNFVTVVGTTGNDTVTLVPSTVSVTGGTTSLPGGTFSNVPLTINNVQGVNLIGGSGGNDALTLISGVRLISATTPLNSGAPNVTVNVLPGTTANFLGDQRLAGLIVNGGTAVLPYAATTLSVAGALQIINGGLLNLQQGQMYVNTAVTAAAIIRGYLASGYNHGAWNGTTGIVSAVAAANPSVQSIGYATAGDSVVPAVPAGQMLLKYTQVGDADLSGTADFNDFLSLQNNFSASGNWSQGDFNYDGAVDYTDFTMLQPFVV